jgi:hypothetical protein
MSAAITYTLFYREHARPRREVGPRSSLGGQVDGENNYPVYFEHGFAHLDSIRVFVSLRGVNEQLLSVLSRALREDTLLMNISFRI